MNENNKEYTELDFIREFTKSNNKNLVCKLNPNKYKDDDNLSNVSELSNIQEFVYDDYLSTENNYLDKEDKEIEYKKIEDKEIEYKEIDENIEDKLKNKEIDENIKNNIENIDRVSEIKEPDTKSQNDIIGSNKKDDKLDEKGDNKHIKENKDHIKENIENKHIIKDLMETSDESDLLSETDKIRNAYSDIGDIESTAEDSFNVNIHNINNSFPTNKNIVIPKSKQPYKINLYTIDNDLSVIEKDSENNVDKYGEERSTENILDKRNNSFSEIEIDLLVKEVVKNNAAETNKIANLFVLDQKEKFLELININKKNDFYLYPIYSPVSRLTSYGFMVDSMVCVKNNMMYVYKSKRKISSSEDETEFEVSKNFYHPGFPNIVYDIKYSFDFLQSKLYFSKKQSFKLRRFLCCSDMINIDDLIDLKNINFKNITEINNEYKIEFTYDNDEHLYTIKNRYLDIVFKDADYNFHYFRINTIREFLNWINLFKTKKKNEIIIENKVV